MTKKLDKTLNKKQYLESKVSKGLTNLEQYMGKMTENLDFTCFDILSITRTDQESAYTRQFPHPKVDTQSYRIALSSGQIVNDSLRKYKLN